MAIRRPSVSSPDWLFQDFLYQETTGLGGSELRYVQIKWDGEVYTRQSETFDYSNPPYVGPEQRGGSIVGQIDYDLNASTKLITIYAWQTNWRDEWPLRLGINYLTQCLYPPTSGYTIRVAGDEVYTQAGAAIDDPNNFPYAFWVSEQYGVLSNEPDTYLVRTASPPPAKNSLPAIFGFDATVLITVPDTYILVTITSTNLPLQTPLYWRLTGGITPVMLVTGETTGVKILNGDTEFLQLSLVRPVPTGPIGFIEFSLDQQFTTIAGTTTVTL